MSRNELADCRGALRAARDETASLQTRLALAERRERDLERTRLRQKAENNKARKAIAGLLEITEVAMPDTFFRTDSRVQAAREVMGKKIGAPLLSS